MQKAWRCTAPFPDDTDQSAVAHLKTGIIKAGQGKNAEAEADLRKAVDLAGDNLESRVVLATFLVRQSRQQEALAVLDIPGQNNKNTALACNAKAGIPPATGTHGRCPGSIGKGPGTGP